MNMSLFKPEPDYSHLPEVPEGKWWCGKCKRFVDAEDLIFEAAEYKCPDCREVVE
jgi:hypothetical protein